MEWSTETNNSKKIMLTLTHCYFRTRMTDDDLSNLNILKYAVDAAAAFSALVHSYWTSEWKILLIKQLMMMTNMDAMQSVYLMMTTTT